MTDTDITFHWFVIQARANHEKAVVRDLRDRIVRYGVSEQFRDILVPSEETVEMKDGQKRRSERKFFPGYVLIEIATTPAHNGLPRISSEAWHVVRETPKVSGFIGGTQDNPYPISQKEADRILSRVEAASEKPTPKTLFEIGQMVRVIDGPFNDFNGVVEAADYDKSTVRVAVLVFGRSTPIDLKIAQVEAA